MEEYGHPEGPARAHLENDNNDSIINTQPSNFSGFPPSLHLRKARPESHTHTKKRATVAKKNEKATTGSGTFYDMTKHVSRLRLRVHARLHNGHAPRVMLAT